MTVLVAAGEGRVHGRARGAAVAAMPLLLVSGGTWSVAEALGSDGPEAVVQEVQVSPQERAEFREAVRHWTETGKWPCPESGRPPKTPTRREGEVDTLERRFGTEDYHCEIQHSEPDGR